MSENKLEKLKEKIDKYCFDNEDKIQKQHNKGKLTARERITYLVDKGSFIELNALVESQATDFGMDKKRVPGDGVITGAARINGKKVFISAQDFTVIGGSLGLAQAQKIAYIQDLALKTGVPIIMLNDSGGARIQEGVDSLHGYGLIFRNNTHASGIIPQVSIILGPCAGGAVYSPAITDFIFMVKSISNMFITGPDVIKEVTGEQVIFEELGGAMTHNKISGVAHFYCESEEECFKMLRHLLSFLPSNNKEIPPIKENNDQLYRVIPELNSLIPDDPKKTFDVKEIIYKIMDEGEFLEIQSLYAPNAVIGFGRLNFRTVGIVANQPKIYAGCLDINSSDKIARFVQFCDAFNIPVINFVDVPGFLPGTAQEYGGVIRHGAKIIYAYADATIPKISIILRKAYGGAYIALAGRALEYDRVLAWPTAEIAVMGAEGAANIIFRNEINNAEDPEKKRIEKIEEYREKFLNPYVAAAKGYIDAIIEPQYTRVELINALEMLLFKKSIRYERKHGNIPL
ncbi:MAG TPA: carboxyl transferase domain-containing protein [bacterium]|nr:carboxyl transferase domain-containing protein [bacterium]HOL48349.1 carboxyl transferase domain-containing protein [bacterium]HPQ19833.1 carboxyl transferase domain-containing protein [bacterium]